MQVGDREPRDRQAELVLWVLSGRGGRGRSAAAGPAENIDQEMTH